MPPQEEEEGGKEKGKDEAAAGDYLRAREGLPRGRQSRQGMGRSFANKFITPFSCAFFRPIRFWLWMYSLDSWISSVLMLILINLFALEDNSAVYFVNELAVLYLNISFCIPDD